MADDNILTITSNNYDQEIAKSDIPVMVDFWAQWCGPCRAVAPIMEELAAEYKGKAKVGKINVDEQAELASKFRIMSIPTVMLFKNGEPVEKVIGARSKKDFSALIDKHV